MPRSETLLIIANGTLDRFDKPTERRVYAVHKKKESEVFRSPVDVTQPGLEDYLKVVTKPMDLSTVKQKLEDSQYKSVKECLDDIQLIWDNCKAFNQTESNIYGFADKLEQETLKMTQTKFKTLAKPKQAAFNKAKKLSATEKREIGFAIQKMKPGQIQALVDYFRNIDKVVIEDEAGDVKLNLDEILVSQMDGIRQKVAEIEA